MTKAMAEMKSALWGKEEIGLDIQSQQVELIAL